MAPPPPPGGSIFVFLPCCKEQLEGSADRAGSDGTGNDSVGPGCGSAPQGGLLIWVVLVLEVILVAPRAL